MRGRFIIGLAAGVLVGTMGSQGALALPASAANRPTDRIRPVAISPQRLLRTRSTRPAPLAGRLQAATLPVGVGVGTNVQVSPADTNVYDTTAAAYDPTRHGNLLAGSDIETAPTVASFSSKDAGASWAAARPPLPSTAPNQFAISPGIAFNNSGTAYESSLGVALYRSSSGTTVSTQVVLSYSIDKGKTWSTPTTVAPSAATPDKPQLAVDQTTSARSHPNRIYVAYDTNPSNTSQPIVLARSDDGTTWSRAQIFDSGGGFGAVPAIGPNGEVYVAWDDYGSTPGGRIAVARSTDGGITASSPRIVANTTVGFGIALQNYGVCNGNPTLVGPTPAIAVDRSGGPHTGSVYVAWADNPSGSTAVPRMHVFFSRLAAGATAWSGPVQIDAGNVNDAWQPSLSVDQSNGAVSIAWYDRREDINANKLYRLYYSQSTDGGFSFLSTPLPIASAASDPTINCLGTGDYAGMVAADGIAHPVWTDSRNGGAQIFTAAVDELKLARDALAARVRFGAGTAATPGIAFSGGASSLADLNRDGVPDLVISKWGYNELTTNLGTGDGTFAPPVSTVVLQPSAPIVADFNRDGYLDVAVASGQANSIVVFPGRGDGTLGTGITTASGSNPGRLALGDFNGDGIADLAVLNALSSNVSIVLGNGDGTFRSISSVPLPANPSQVVVADVNHDGKADLAIEVANVTRVELPPSIDLAFGNGNGTFQAPQAYAAGPYMGALTTADFNHDGYADIALTNQGDHTGQLSILLNDGTGKLLLPATYLPNVAWWSVISADFNRDGIPDLAVTGADGLAILTGKGDGTFQVGPIYAGLTGAGPAAADVNRDGAIDLVEGGWVILGNGDGSFQAARDFAVGNGPQAVATGDFNGDGKADIAVANATGGVSVLPGNGDGSLQAPRATSLPNPAVNASQALVAADFNGDGKLDLAVITTSSPPTAVVLLGNGDFTFQAGVSYTVGTVGLIGLAAADVNGDGKPDLLTSNGDQRVGADTVYVLLNDGSGTFHVAPTIAAGATLGAPAIGDFNGDGKADMVIGITTNSSCCGVPGQTRLYLGNGDGTFNAGYVLNANMGEAPIAGDINGDGKLDVVTFGQYAGRVYLGNGDGTFGAPLPSGIRGGNAMAVADVNGDGRQDLIEVSASGPWTGVQLANADGTTQEPVYLVVGAAPAAIAAADLNGDGTPDIVATDKGLNAAAIALRMPPRANLAPSSVSYGSIARYSGSVARAARVTNIGSFPMHVAMAQIVGVNAADFSKTVDTCSGVTLLPGSTCEVDVQFKPLMYGSRSANLLFVDDAPGGVQSSSLTGTGVRAAAIPGSTTAPRPILPAPSSPTVPPHPRGGVPFNTSSLQHLDESIRFV